MERMRGVQKRDLEGFCILFFYVAIMVADCLDEVKSDLPCSQKHVKQQSTVKSNLLLINRF